jgi:hypothetical protein
MKFLYPYLILIFIGVHSKAQSLEDSAHQIADDTSNSFWKHNVSPKIYYLVGKIQAKRDLDNGIFLIQTYGNPGAEKPCSACRYENYGFKFVYHWDIVYDTKTEFIEGYNEVSQAYLKAKIGANAFARIDQLPGHYFDPAEVLRQFNYSKNRRRFYLIDVLNDSTIRVKLKVDSIFKDYPTLVKKIAYSIKSFSPDPIFKDSVQVLSYEKMKRTGFVVNKNAKGEFSYSITYDLSQLPADKLFCGCTFKTNIYSYIDRLKVALQ